jgi:hypothetical protein
VNVSSAAPRGRASRRPRGRLPSEPLTIDPPIRVRGGRSTRSDRQISRQGQPDFDRSSLTRRGAMPVRRPAWQGAPATAQMEWRGGGSSSRTCPRAPPTDIAECHAGKRAVVYERRAGAAGPSLPSEAPLSGPRRADPHPRRHGGDVSVAVIVSAAACLLVAGTRGELLPGNPPGRRGGSLDQEPG